MQKFKRSSFSKKIEQIEKRSFTNCNELELKNFENEYIKIKNNNIYQKGELDYLVSCNQKNDTLIINENDMLETIISKNIKLIKVIGKTQKKLELEIGHKVQDIVYSNIEIFNNKNIPNNLKNLYLPNTIKKIYNVYPKIVKNLYINDKIDQTNQKNLKKAIIYNNIIYQKNIEELLNDGYNFKQIDLIIKGYDKNILLSNVNKSIDEYILRDIIEKFNYDDFELYNILELLQEEISLENKIKIQEIIRNQTQNKTIDIKEDIIH